MNVQNIVKNGFSLNENKNHGLDIALLSLKIGIEAYLSTYSKMQRFFEFTLEQGDSEDAWEKHLREKNIQRSLTTSGYLQLYFETIFHLHHFIELSFKEILRQEDELLASTANRNPIILHKLLKGQEITSNERENLFSISFKEALKRLVPLIKKERIGNYQGMEFIKNNEKFLKQLNFLRGRLAHRGTFVLHYKALDELFGKYILPFVKSMLMLPIYENIDFTWQPKKLYCNIDPIQEIIDEWQTSNPDFRKIAVLKQLTLAAYKNPLKESTQGWVFSPTSKEIAERKAEKELKNYPEAVDIKTCPVCGANALVRYIDIYTDYDFSPDNVEYIISSVSCHCCSFELDRNLEEVSSINGLELSEYWQLP